MTDDELRLYKLRAAGAHGLDHADSLTLFAEITRLCEERDAARLDNLTLRGLLVSAREREAVARTVAVSGYSAWPSGSKVAVQRIEVPASAWREFMEVFGS